MIDYPAMVVQALRGLVRDLLIRVAEEGLPGDHYFYFTFQTSHADVVISPALRDRYPQEMTVVLQHQYWDLEVEEEAFEVSLRFGGTPHRLRIPFAALTRFVDPSAEFGLHLDDGDTLLDRKEPTASEQPMDLESEGRVGGGEVVSMEEFRKRDDS